MVKSNVREDPSIQGFPMPDKDTTFVATQNSRVELVQPGHAGVDELSKDGCDSFYSEQEEDRAQKNVFVWYACYGSNLLEERFNCYLRGGRVNGMSRNCIGARDTRPASCSLVMWMPYRVFFAYAREMIWGCGGSAMLDVRPDDEYMCCMRLYKVTLQQFNDVIAQENNLLPPLPSGNWLTCDQLTHLQSQEPGSLRLQFENGDYPAVAYLGDHDGAAIVTFTCLTDTVRKFLSEELPADPPPQNYLLVLRRGLQEAGLDEAGAINYWNEVITRQFVKYTSYSSNINEQK
jgi:histone deacetylase 4/5